MNRLTYMLLAAFALTIAVPSAQAQYNKPKVVKVKTYKTKKGKTVKSYKRTKPKKK